MSKNYLVLISDYSTAKKNEKINLQLLRENKLKKKSFLFIGFIFCSDGTCKDS